MHVLDQLWTGSAQALLEHGRQAGRHQQQAVNLALFVAEQLHCQMI